MTLTVVEHAPTHTHLALAGVLDGAGVSAIEFKFLGLVTARRLPAILDLSGVTFIGSRGIALMLGAAKDLARHRAGLVVLGPQPLIAQTIRLTRVPLTLAATLADARAALGLPPA